MFRFEVVRFVVVCVAAVVGALLGIYERHYEQPVLPSVKTPAERLNDVVGLYSLSSEWKFVGNVVYIPEREILACWVLTGTEFWRLQYENGWDVYRVGSITDQGGTWDRQMTEQIRAIDPD